MGSGWIKLYRQIQDCWVWKDKPFSKGQAWIDLIVSANHADTKIPFNGELITIKRGQYLTSIRNLAEKWEWSRNTVSKFLNLLESDRMLVKDSDRYRTLLTIVNYEVYQGCEATKEPPIEPPSSHTLSTNKNVKNDKNVEKNNMCKAEAVALFEELWKLYPVKKGKGQISLAAKQRLLKVGYDEMVRAIDRYKAELEKDSDWRKPQNGSTFFNSGYVDYLDKNYEGGSSGGCAGRNDTKNITDPYADEFERLLNE